jgi:3D (Asp-Asp-Asp) domain-containing protein
MTHPEPDEVCAPTTTSHDVRVEVNEKTKDGKIVKMMVTAYCTCKKCCGKWSKRKRTALGDNALVMDGVAADFTIIPRRAELTIPGVGVKEVDDTGGRMREDGRKGITHIDVRMKSHRIARRFGVKWLDVEVVTPDAN